MMEKDLTDIIQREKQEDGDGGVRSEKSPSQSQSVAAVMLLTIKDFCEVQMNMNNIAFVSLNG